MKEKIELPKVLDYYSKSDYSTQQKARFIFYLCIAAIVGVLLLTFSSVYVQLNSSEYNKLFSPVVFSEIVLLMVFGLCIFLLIKGKYSVSTHLFMITAMACVWIVLWVHQGNNIARLDTVILIIALINLTPLFITKYKITIVFYILANLLMLIVFVFFTKDQLNLSNPTAIDFIMDTSIAIIFSGVVGYNIFRINKQSLEKVEYDYKERKKAEEALKQSELLRRNVFDSSQIPIVVMNSNTFEYIDINPAAVKAYGFSSIKASLGKTPIDVSAPVQYDGTPSSQKAVSYIDKALKDGSVTFEWLHQRPNGNFWDAEVHLLSFESNNETLLQFSLVDITERKKVERDLKESEEKYRTLMENMNDIVMMVDNNDKVLYVNKRFSEILGYSESEIIGQIGYEILTSPKDQKVIVDANNQRIKNIISQYEITLKAKNGNKLDFLVSGAPVRNSEGKIIGSIGNMIDITERKQAERALKESEVKFKELYEKSGDAILIIENGKFVECNKAAIEILEYNSKEDVLNIRPSQISPEFQIDGRNSVEKADEMMKIALKNGTHRFEWLHSKNNGEIFPAEVLLTAISNDADKKIIHAVVRDITDRKQAEKELEKHQNHLELLVKERTEELATSNEELLSTNEDLHNQREELEAVLLNLQNAQKQLVQAEKMASLGVLASGVAHEINNPLNFIKGGIFGLEQYFDENLKEHKNEVAPLIEGVNVGIERAANIVTSLNHYSRQDNSNVSECDIHSIIDNSLIMLRNQIVNNIDIKKDYTDKTYSLLANEGKLHQAMLNILSNAVQAIDDKGTINIETTISKNNIAIFISDTGCGITAENMPKILDPFFTTKEAGQGKGLGLSITYNIIKEHNGSIKIDSKVGHGTTVKITLPLNETKK